MKKLLALAFLVFTVGNTAYAQLNTLNPQALNALQTTQLLTAQKCKVKANLDPVEITERSTAFAFVAALFANSSPELLHQTTQRLVEKIKNFRCDSGGILQLT